MLPGILHAQKDPIKWGKIPVEHLTMDSYPADTNATAVILADYGTAYFDSRRELIFERHTRIKILSEAGYEWGTVNIPYLNEDGTQKVRSVRGQTFVMGPNGKQVRHKLSKKDIFTEKVDDAWKQVKFTLPALEPGAVIEYSYKLTSENPIFLRGWQFQYGEPVLWSEYRAAIPKGFNYVNASVGMLSFFIQEQEENYAREEMQHRWVMRDVPALRKEPYMTTPKDYRAALQFQLSSISDPRMGVYNFMNTWEKVADELLHSSWFGKKLKPHRDVRDQVAALTGDLTDPVEKMKAIYDYVRTTIAFNDEMGIGADQDMKEVLKTKRASSPEIALLLVTMMRAADLEADPVLISTRSHGQVIQIYPILSQFNDVLALVRINGESYLLDATDPLRPYDLLPPEALNGRGWWVREDAPAWIDIQASGRYVHLDAVEATLHADGRLTVSLTSSDGEYGALVKRHAFRAASDTEAFVNEEVITGLETVSLNDHRVLHAEDLTEALKTEASFEVPAYAQVAGDFIYLNPVMLGRMTENPLRLPERTYPVDLTYPRDLNYTLRLKLPAGYTVQETPPNIRVPLPLKAGQYQRIIAVEDDVLVVQRRLQIKRSVFGPELYPSLRGFYERVVAAEAEQVVLNRSTEDPTSTGGAQ
jgi:hypothetical protein